MKKNPGMLAVVLSLVLIGCGNADQLALGPDPGFELTQSGQTSVNTKLTGMPTNPAASLTAKFTFKCSAGSCSYQCKLGSKAWQSCSSPKSYKHLAEGSHTFMVKAGQNGVWDRTPASWSWTIELTDIWLPMSASPLAGREQAVAVWTGSEMIIWGGRNMVLDYIYHRDGARYNPVTDAWNLLPTKNAPSGRFQSAGVWTAGVPVQEMIVWGGWDNANLNNGGIYRPTTNSWSAMLSDNAPSARCRHTAIWTGAEMIVWGGYGGSNTGGRYDLTNGWTATSTDNAPSYRYNHTAVYTGVYIIIWGGKDDSTKFNDGGRYQVSSDSWYTVSTDNAPSARYEHTAVWDNTDNKMIIWGGDAGGCTNSGGLYDPSLDSWTPTSTVNAPDARCFHSAAWTGADLFVWGGSLQNGSLINTGGRYNAAGNSWTSTTLLNAPAVREHTQAVNSGSTLLIWSGWTGSETGWANTGGRYYY